MWDIRFISSIIVDMIDPAGLTHRWDEDPDKLLGSMKDKPSCTTPILTITNEGEEKPNPPWK